MSSAFDYYSETKTGFGFNLKPVLLNRMRPVSQNYFFYNNSNTKCPITIFFGILSSQATRHRKMISFPSSPI